MVVNVQTSFQSMGSTRGGSAIQKVVQPFRPITRKRERERVGTIHYHIEMAVVFPNLRYINLCWSLLFLFSFCNAITVYYNYFAKHILQCGNIG